MDENLEKQMGQDEDALTAAEEAAENGRLDEAQKILDEANVMDARWRYVQGKIFLKRDWKNEARKQFELAAELEPENVIYRAAYDELCAAGESSDEEDNQEEYNQFENPYSRKKRNKYKQMGKTDWKDVCGEACAEGCCMCCAEGICEGICNGG